MGMISTFSPVVWLVAICAVGVGEAKVIFGQTAAGIAEVIHREVVDDIIKGAVLANAIPKTQNIRAKMRLRIGLVG